MLRVFLTILTVTAGFPLEGMACPVRFRSYPIYSSVSYASPVVAAVVTPVITPVAVAVYAPIPVAQYSVGYNAAPAYAPQQAQAPMAQQVQAQDPCAALRKDLEALRAEVQALRGGPQGLKAPPEQVKAPPGEHPALGILRAKCAQCHEQKVAKTEGKGFVLFNGPDLAQLTDRQVLRVGAQCYSGRMPPPNNTKKVEPLTDTEVGQVMQYIDQRSNQGAAP